MIEIISSCISIFLYIFMLVHVYKCEGNIECISDIAYDKHSRLFPICMILMGLSLLIGMWFVTDIAYRWLCFIPVISIIVVSLVPYKNSKSKYWIHVSFALLSFISTFILWILHGYWYVPILFCISSLRTKWLLGLEMGLISSGFMYLLMFL